ncbi:MAG: hypothetical protein AAF441_28785 [Pseudomonadota bacterium]
MMRIVLSAAFVSTLALAAHAEGVTTTAPAALNTQQSTQPAATAPQSAPAPASDFKYEYGSGDGGCPFGHKKMKSAATS